MGVEVTAEVRVQLLVSFDGWVGGGVGEKKNEINAVLISVEIKVEIGVEHDNIKACKRGGQGAFSLKLKQTKNSCIVV